MLSLSSLLLNSRRIDRRLDNDLITSARRADVSLLARPTHACTCYCKFPGNQGRGQPAWSWAAATLTYLLTYLLTSGGNYWLASFYPGGKYGLISLVPRITIAKGKNGLLHRHFLLIAPLPAVVCRICHRQLVSMYITSLHWFDVPKSVQYNCSPSLSRCSNVCRTDTCSRLLRSGLRFRHSSTFTLRQSTSLDCAAHSVAGPSLFGTTTWNALPDDLRDASCDVGDFRRMLKTALFTR